MMAKMRVYILSLGAGLLVGVVYSLLNVRSPAPPVVALVGLLGILAGEQIIPVAKHMLDGSHLAAAWHQAHGTAHVFGLLPGRHERAAKSKIDAEIVAENIP
jgi:XapX domain-containing protein